MARLIAAALAAALLVPGAPSAADTVPLRLSTDADRYEAATHLRVIEDPAHALDPQRAASSAEERGRNVAGETETWGRSRSAFWARFDVVRAGHRSGDWRVVFAQSLADEVRLRRFEDGTWREIAPVYEETRERVFGGARYAAFRLALDPGERASLLLRIETTSFVRFPVRLEEAAAHERDERLRRTLGGMLLAIPVVVAVVVLFMWSVSRDPALPPFLGLIVALSLGAFWISGMLAEMFPMLARRALNAAGASFFSVALIFALLHARRFFGLDASYPRLARIHVLAAYLFVAAIALEVAGLPAARHILTFGSGAVMCGLFVLSLWRWRAGMRYAGIYALAWASFVASSLLLLAARLGFVSPDPSSHITFAQGSIVSLVFTLAVIGQLRDRDRSLSAALEAERAVKRALEAFRVELQNAKDAAERANLARARLFAAANHDLRQPLQSLGIFLELLAREPLAAPLQEHVQRMRSAYLSLADFLDALLDLSRLESAASLPAPRDFPVGELLERLAAEYRSHAGGAGLQLRCVPCSAWVRTDPRLIERILRNLLSNALRYTRRGKVLVGCRRGNASVLVQVWDTGTGIAPAEIDRIFEEFFQGGNATAAHAGVGLGLAIVKRLADTLGLDLTVRSLPGRGSVFSVRVPRAAPGSSAVAPSAAPATARLEGIRVLVIDDEPDVLDSLRRLLAALGARVEAAPGVAEALEKLAVGGFMPEVMVTDLRLRGPNDGLEGARRVREKLGWPVPVLIVTGDTSPARIAELSRSGYAYVHKPVSPGELASAMQAALGER